MCSRKGSQLKPKGLKNGNKENVYKIHSLKLLNSYSIVGLKNNLLPSMKVHCKVVGHSYDILGARMLWKPKEARIFKNF